MKWFSLAEDGSPLGPFDSEEEAARAAFDAKPDPRIREIRTVGDTVVYLVNGRMVRDAWDLNFTQGGNSERYNWMDKHEIWIDDANVSELDFILLHELHEVSVMRELSLKYEHAHELANEVEQKARNNVDKLPVMLEKEIQRAVKVQKLIAKDGQLATDPPVSEAQRRAMYAAASGHSTLGIPKKVGEEFVGKAKDTEMKNHAAGVLHVAPDGEVLMLRRAGEEGKDNYVGHWALPGGKGNDGESPMQTAARESKEEMGDAIPNGKMKLLDARETPNGMHFFTFVQPVGSKFVPKLNEEHSGYAWSPLHQLPAPLHPGVSATFSERLLDGKTSNDMTPEDWKGLREGFTKWTREEEAEEEHQGQDALPAVAQRLMDNAHREQISEWAYEGAEWTARNHKIPLAAARALVDKAKEIERDWHKSWGDHAMDKSPFFVGRKSDRLALDKESVRSYDKDGRLHISRTPISKANICPYYGNEIPGGEALGLKPDKIYKLLRDPEELAKAAKTSNGQPLLDEHIPTTADDHAKDNVVGSTGTDAEFEEPYLYNSLVIWPRDAITGVEKDKKRELSSAYHYDPDMTPGTYKGEAYDGVMRNIVFNHVCLVKDGRAGSDVLVMDAALPQDFDFTPFTPAFDFQGFKPERIAFDAFSSHLYSEGITERYRGYSIVKKGNSYQPSRMGLSVGNPASSIAGAKAEIDKDIERRNKGKGFSRDESPKEEYSRLNRQLQELINGGHAKGQVANAIQKRMDELKRGARDAFTPEGYANTKNQPTGTIINKGDPMTHVRPDGKGISRDAGEWDRKANSTLGQVRRGNKFVLCDPITKKVNSDQLLTANSDAQPTGRGYVRLESSGGVVNKPKSEPVFIA